MDRDDTEHTTDNATGTYIIFLLIIIIINVNIINNILIIREDKFSLCEFVCLEKKIFKVLHQIFYVQIVFGYYFATYVCGPTIWTNFDYTYPKTICM